MRRLALFAVGVAVAALLLPAASAWLRQPAASPLPDPVNLHGAADWEQRQPRASDRRVRRKLVALRSQEKTTRRRLPGRDGARPVALMPASARAAAAAAEGNDDGSDVDRAVHAVPDDDDDGDELGDG